jgi:hypothetical protein
MQNKVPAILYIEHIYKHGLCNSQKRAVCNTMKIDMCLKGIDFYVQTQLVRLRSFRFAKCFWCREMTGWHFPLPWDIFYLVHSQSNPYFCTKMVSKKLWKKCRENTMLLIVAQTFILVCDKLHVIETSCAIWQRKESTSGAKNLISSVLVTYRKRTSSTNNATRGKVHSRF